MHVMFVHQNFPAQFGHIARHLIRSRGWTCTFVSKTPPGEVNGIRKIEYRTAGGARATTHYCSRTFENATWHAHGVYEACKADLDLRPDLIVGHSGFGSTVFLPELYPGVPIVNYFEFYYHPHQSDMDFRPEFPPAELDYLRAGRATQCCCSIWRTAATVTVRPISSGSSSPKPTARKSTSSSMGSRRTSSAAGRRTPPDRRPVDPRIDPDRDLRQPWI